MGKKLEDLKLSDEPLGPALQPKQFAIARAHAADIRRVSVDKTVVALYRAPGYLRSGLEAVSEEATNGAMEPAAIALLEEGLSTIRRFPGVAKISAARLVMLSLGHAETMRWFNEFPAVSVDTANTDDSGTLRLHVPTSLAKKFAKLARSLGMSASRLTIFALMAGLLQMPSCSAPRYRRAMFKTLKRLKAAIKRRGDEADTRAAAAAPRDSTQDHLWTVSDLLESKGENDADDE